MTTCLKGKPENWFSLHPVSEWREALSNEGVLPPKDTMTTKSDPGQCWEKPIQKLSTEWTRS